MPDKIAPLLHLPVDAHRKILRHIVGLFFVLLILSLISGVGLVWSGLQTIDDLENKNDVEVMRSLLEDRKSQIVKLLKDYAEWNEAYRNFYSKMDLAFADENIGHNLYVNYAIGSASIVSFDRKILLHFEQGSRVENPSVLPPQITSLYENLIADFNENPTRSVADFAEIDGALYIVAASFISLIDENAVALPLPENPSVMIFARKIEAGILADWGKGFNITSLRYASTGSGKIENIDGYLKLESAFAHPIGALLWKPSFYSRTVLKDSAPLLLFAFSIILVLGGLFSAFTRRVLAQQATIAVKAERSRKFLQQVFDTDPSLIQVRDKEGVIHFANLAAASQFDSVPDKIQGKTLYQAHKDSERAKFDHQEDLKVIVSQKDIVQEESVELPDGTVKHFFTIRKPIQSTSLENLVLCLGTDITAQKRFVEDLKLAKEKAEAAATAKSEFLGTISHEIRTPMNGILGFSQLLSATELSAEQKDYLGIIQNSSKSLLAVINDILDMSRIETGKLRLEEKIFNPADVLNAVMATAQPMAKEKGLQIVHEIIGGAPRKVVGDDGRIVQILMNLVGNAVKFTDKGGITLRLSSSRQEPGRSYLKFEVIDTGIGIDPDQIKKIFKKFSQIDSTASRRYGGTGLGLAIAKDLAQLMGGEIGVDTVPGKGSNFWLGFSLPDALKSVDDEVGFSRA